MHTQKQDCRPWLLWCEPVFPLTLLLKITQLPRQARIKNKEGFQTRNVLHTGSDAPEAHPWGNCTGNANGSPCSDKYNCSLPELGPDGQVLAGKYGDYCAPWNEEDWCAETAHLFPLCLSRACLGNLIVFAYGILNGNSSKRRFCRAPALRPLAKLVRANDPSGIPGNNFMGGIHPRLKRPVGRRLAYAAARMLKKQEAAASSGGAQVRKRAF
jgi:hypothetical protein